MEYACINSRIFSSHSCQSTSITIALASEVSVSKTLASVSCHTDWTFVIYYLKGIIECASIQKKYFWNRAIDKAFIDIKETEYVKKIARTLRYKEHYKAYCDSRIFQYSVWTEMYLRSIFYIFSMVIALKSSDIFYYMVIKDGMRKSYECSFPWR